MSLDKTQFDAYVLIGGRSSRLGRDKAFVDLNGRTLLQRSVEAVRDALSPNRITAVAGNAEQFAIEAIIADVRFIFDLYENRGPLGGFQAALADTNSEWIFVLACDYPFVSSELIKMLSQNISDEFGCVVPEQNDGRLQPLCGFYKVELARPIVDGMIMRPRVTPPMHEVIREMNPKLVRFESFAHLEGADRFFLNINTPSDLSSATREIADPI